MSVITFCEELAEALEWDITGNTKQLVMIGDFNIHMDSRDNSDTIIFNDFLESFRLENRVHFCDTHFASLLGPMHHREKQSAN